MLLIFSARNHAIMWTDTIILLRSHLIYLEQRKHTRAIMLQFQEICLWSRGYGVWYEKIQFPDAQCHFP